LSGEEGRGFGDGGVGVDDIYGSLVGGFEVGVVIDEEF